MDPIHKKVLANKTSDIMKRVSNPGILVAHLKTIFSPADTEEIEAKTSNRGPTAGTQTLLSILEKRGAKAFLLFLYALREEKNEELAEELEEEERNLRGKAVRRGNSFPQSNDNENNDFTVRSPPPPYSAPAGSSLITYDYSVEQQSLKAGQKPDVEINPLHENSSATNKQLLKQNKGITEGSLVKDIPFATRTKIERMMNVNNHNDHNWRGLAAAMNLSVDDVRQMEEGEKGKMAGLFDNMIHLKKTIKDLLDLLRNQAVQRLDVIDEIVQGCHLPKNLSESDNSELHETDSASKATSLPYSEQESQEAKAGCDTKPDARSPCQIEDDDDPKGKEAVAAKPDARIPCQEEDDRPNGKTASDTKPDARVPSQVEDDDDPKNRAQSDSKPDARWPSQVEHDDDPKNTAQSDSKPEARLPSQVEYDDHPKRRALSDTKPDARVPSQVEDDDDLKSRVLLDTKPDARVPSQVEGDEDPALRSRTKRATRMPYQGDDEDDVFESTGNKEVKRNALLLNCFGSSKTDKMHNSQLQELENVLEDHNWDVKCHRKCKASELLQAVHSFLDANSSDESLSFIYLAGPTVHINGKNYLLPTDLKCPSSQADLMRDALDINWLVSHLSENYMQVVVVDGAFENAQTDIKLKGVLKGLAPIPPPPNAVIAFPCHPGTIRPEQERLDYIKCLLANLEDDRIMLCDLFDKVRDELMKKNPNCSVPIEFSLSPSLFPLRLKTENNKGLHLESNVTCHAIIVANSTYSGSGLINTNQCLKDCEKLRMALLKGQWECTEVINKTGKEIKNELRESLNKLSEDKKDRVVMVYFMGYTRKILDCNCFFGRDFTVGSPEPLRLSVPLKWVLDLMCEKLKGPKILIVDDLGTSQPEGLVPMTAPNDVLISLPRENKPGPNEASVTTKFAGFLETKAGELSLKEMVQKATFDRHRLSSSLYLN
ncbi:unnamed protein product [Porites evermanni]|uniref:CARD domain-containing protein n=1 Tax=Porites evermanni TaxID=104178 RepID=A0ABN8M555_9CNID|nr:unnamed protein product [Porites evermanni]